MTTLRENILKALTGSSSQTPVQLTMLQSMIVPKVKLDELSSELETMCHNRELQTCNGFRDGKAYVCYWISGMLPPAWRAPRKVTADAAKPGAEPVSKKKKV